MEMATILMIGCFDCSERSAGKKKIDPDSQIGKKPTWAEKSFSKDAVEVLEI
jgi:hypothetical protein